ncbi:hypothetical protein F503_03816 [Ophiostoma piceae UAMH 11346]|uniref:TNT domain-containing protein n=1 Tax=Ophiostoma piceae (strain UAMH 11346) TaxID=1262450 RepID=S3C0L4_OPHP1|nr:hypothetical protein F503_03816 [Ophiostoma piceae UAMH 11346]
MFSLTRPSFTAAAAIYALATAATVFGDCSPNKARYCAGTAGNATLNSTYVCDDPRLGPVVLPSNPPTEGLVEIYDRFGGLCPGQFLATFYDESAKSWIYPSDGGFQLDTAGDPIAAEMTLPVGLLIDRFGSEYGLYASPAAAPYMQRALPPSNLDTPAGNPAYPYNYHLYRVIDAFEVTAGPIAPWFGQPGQGVQYKLNASILALIDGGFLERANLTALN